MIEEIITSIRNYWSDKENLFKILISIAERQLELAESIAREESAINTAFVNEADGSYKSTDARIRARARELVGSNKTRYEYEYEVLKELIHIITLRISQLPPILQQAS